MKYPIAIKQPISNSEAWSVVVPDLEGCFSASDSGVDEAIENAKEAIELWIETAFDRGQDIPLPSLFSEMCNDPRFKGWEVVTVEIDSDALRARCQNQTSLLLNDQQELVASKDLEKISDKTGWS